jgi:hypothetical protein
MCYIRAVIIIVAMGGSSVFLSCLLAGAPTRDMNILFYSAMAELVAFFCFLLFFLTYYPSFVHSRVHVVLIERRTRRVTEGVALREYLHDGEDGLLQAGAYRSRSARAKKKAAGHTDAGDGAAQGESGPASRQASPGRQAAVRAMASAAASVVGLQARLQQLRNRYGSRMDKDT